MKANKFLQLLIEIIDKNDPYKSGHSEKVAKLSALIGRQLNLSKTQLDALEFGSLLHDLGKVLLPGELWCTPEKLADEEFEIVRKHSRLGAELLQSCDFSENVINIVKYHHEMWNGTGYPEKLQKEEIPLLARIVALAEVYISMISYELYSDSLEKEKAVKKIKNDSGLRFDPKIVQAFLQVISDDSNNIIKP